MHTIGEEVALAPSTVAPDGACAHTPARRRRSRLGTAAAPRLLRVCSAQALLTGGPHAHAARSFRAGGHTVFCVLLGPDLAYEDEISYFFFCSS